MHTLTLAPPLILTSTPPRTLPLPLPLPLPLFLPLPLTPTQVRGQLEASAAAIAAWNAPPRTPTDPLSLRIEGSGAHRIAQPNSAEL